jgi:hypothetical protein
MRFTQNVMEEISKLYIAPATKSYINKKIIYGIGGFFYHHDSWFAGFILLLRSNWSEGGTSSAMPDFDAVNWSTLLNNTYINIS